MTPFSRSADCSFALLVGDNWEFILLPLTGDIFFFVGRYYWSMKLLIGG
jgi:hypothetical protein